MTERSGGVRRHRYSLALVVPGSVATEIDGIRRALGARELERIPPHITLVPPVNVRDDDDAEVFVLMRAAAARSTPIELAIGPTATFWPRNPVLYLAVGGDESDLQVMEQMRSTLAHPPLLGPATRHERGFVPHVTLATGIVEQRLRAGLEALQDYGQVCGFERLTLLELGEEARWLPVADVELGRPAVVGTGGLPVKMTVCGTPDLETRTWLEAAWRAYGTERYGADWRPDEPLTIVARREGAIAGVAELEVRGDVGELSRLVVAPAARSQGIGALLLRESESQALSRGCTRLRLRTISGGPAEQFYARHGYSVSASLPCWRGGLDFVVMERPLSRTRSG